MTTPYRTFLVYSSSSRIRGQMCAQLSAFGRAIPIGCVHELRMSLPHSGWIFAEDDPETFPEVIRAVRELRLAYPVIAFGEPKDATDLIRAIDAGAIRYLRYPVSSPEMIETMIEDIAVEADAAVELLEKANDADAQLSRLSPREMEVLLRVCQGHSNKMTALMLGISPRTVEVHRSVALKKLGVENCYEALHKIIDANRLQPEKIRCLSAFDMIESYNDTQITALAS